MQMVDLTKMYDSLSLIFLGKRMNSVLKIG